jgi:ATP-dependent DNA ligase
VPAGIELNDHTDVDGAAVFRHACAMGLEGIVSKWLAAPYRSGLSRDWIKIKNPSSPAMIRVAGAFRTMTGRRFPPTLGVDTCLARRLIRCQQS